MTDKEQDQRRNQRGDQQETPDAEGSASRQTAYNEDVLLSASQAAKRFGVSPMTAQRRARAAIARGDTRVQHIEAGYLAEEEVWRELIPGPATMGRPRRTPPTRRDDERDLPPEIPHS